MTFLEVRYRYHGPLSANQCKRIGELTGRYGILGIWLEEEKSTARIRFDASRLKESEVVHWVRRAGLPLTERITITANSVST